MSERRGSRRRGERRTIALDPAAAAKGEARERREPATEFRMIQTHRQRSQARLSLNLLSFVLLAGTLSPPLAVLAAGEDWPRESMCEGRMVVKEQKLAAHAANAVFKGDAPGIELQTPQRRCVRERQAKLD
jgi:hypothetical protein